MEAQTEYERIHYIGADGHFRLIHKGKSFNPWVYGYHKTKCGLSLNDHNYFKTDHLCNCKSCGLETLEDRIEESSWGESTATKPKEDARSEVDKCWTELTFKEISSCPCEPRCRLCHIRVMTENVKRGREGALEEWREWSDSGQFHYPIEMGQVPLSTAQYRPN